MAFVQTAAQDVEERLRRTREFMGTGHLDRAEKEILRAVEAAPQNAEVRRLLCEMRRVQGRREDAVLACRKAVDLAPARSDYMIALGDLLVQREDGVDEAIRAYRRAVEVDVTNPRPYIRLGSIYERQGRMQDAEAEYREALALNPNLVQANAGLGAVLFITGRLVEARRFLGRAIELRPRDLRSHIFLGLALNHDGQIDLALQELRTAIGIDPHAANAAAGVQDQRPRFEKLREVFAAQLEANPRDSSVLYNLGVVAYYLRDYEAAWRHIIKAQQFGYPVDMGLKEVVYARWRRLSDR